MAQEGGLHWGTKRVRPWASLSRIKQPRLAIWFAMAGALSFWLPDVAIHIYAGRNLDSRHIWAITILAPATFLLAYVVARTFAAKRAFSWLGAAMLLGVWVSGGLFITLAATASERGFVGPHGFRDSLFMIVSSVIPGVAYILAAYDGSFLALLAVTVGALLLWGLRKSWILLVSGSSADQKTAANYRNIH
ncbi:MAG: hypothetical protein WAN03_07750 [Candidatus Sulfotelmatobacter sp.]